MSGCTYVIGRTSRWNACLRRNESVPYFCHKIPSPTSELFPLHELIAEDEAHKEERRLAKRQADREFRKLQEEELAISPLAAVNPLFEEKQKDLGYSK